ncbi:hypothetical protein HMPREF1092_03287 [Clostridium thermobutyricum]|uniref:Uncharacterized protein n=1 Tax=Clostridium thermobutyricum TaxID=29372 RepID=N9W795_9CLOT|nr:hypothetical protein [Clostridium thermobutyricum]ENY98729.1 hypothetical protein HMPREF1092_03287 [Clostridium thermobutyricum]
MATKEEMKKEIIKTINNLNNPYWIEHLYKYIVVIKKQESI